MWERINIKRQNEVSVTANAGFPVSNAVAETKARRMLPDS
jgi:hypothetical protein